MNKCKINEEYIFDTCGQQCLICDYFNECMEIYERYYLELW